MRMRVIALEQGARVLQTEADGVWDTIARLTLQLSRLADVADPITLEAKQRAAYKNLSRLQVKVEDLGKDLENLVAGSDIETLRRLLDQIWEEIGLMKNRQEQTWASPKN